MLSCRSAVEDDVLVDLVADDEDVGAVDERGQRRDVVGGEDRRPSDCAAC